MRGLEVQCGGGGSLHECFLLKKNLRHANSRSNQRVHIQQSALGERKNGLCGPMVIRFICTSTYNYEEESEKKKFAVLGYLPVPCSRIVDKFLKAV